MYRYKCPCSFNTIPQLIIRSDRRMVMSQSLGIMDQMFSINEKSGERVQDAVSRVAANIFSELRVHAAANIVEMFVWTMGGKSTTRVPQGGMHELKH
ncbi:hypothetical protein TNCV_537971 [Trichonephila clavipes]|nr:hypothetical protein TNCV_537971 [Trichonephila clavipes]